MKDVTNNVHIIKKATREIIMMVVLRDKMHENGDSDHELDLTISGGTIEIKPRLYKDGREMTVAIEVWDNEFRVLVWDTKASENESEPQIITVGPMQTAEDDMP